jgi:hypothetical protein
LIRYWGLPAPNFILETNESNEHQNISAQTAPYILQDIFQLDQAETAETKNYEDFELTEATQYASESTSYDVPLATPEDKAKGFPRRALSWIREEAPWLEKLKQKQEIQRKKLSTNDWMFVNKYLQRKLIQVLSSIVSAADLTNGWILCHGSPSSNEKMLEIAIERTGSSPTVLVVDDLAGYERQWKVGNPVRALLMRLEKAGTPLNLQANDGDEQRKEEPIEFEVFDNYDMRQRRGSQQSLYVQDGRSQRT